MTLDLILCKELFNESFNVIVLKVENSEKMITSEYKYPEWMTSSVIVVDRAEQAKAIAYKYIKKDKNVSENIDLWALYYIFHSYHLL